MIYDIVILLQSYTDDLSMIYLCFGMNGHPRARMTIILRQCEAPVKIFDLQAPQHRFTGLNARLWLAKGENEK